MQTSESTTAIGKALAAAMATLKNPKATGKAKVQKKQGGSYEYRYPELPDIVEDVRASLALHDLAALQEAVTDEQGRVGVSTRIIHASGEWIELGPFFLSAGATAQEHGSALTYARRYALTAALLLAADEDDDGKKASDGARSRSSSDIPAEGNATAERNPQARGGGEDGGAGLGYGEGPDPAAADRERLWRDVKSAFGGQSGAIAAVNAAAGKSYTAKTILEATPAELAAALAQEVLG